MRDQFEWIRSVTDGDGPGGALRSINLLTRLLLLSRTLGVELLPHILERVAAFSKPLIIMSQLRTTFSRRPSCGASTVIKSPLQPRFSACWTIRFVTARSRFTYLHNVHVPASAKF